MIFLCLNRLQCVVVMNQEDISHEYEKKSICPIELEIAGTLQIALVYDAPLRKMTVHILEARNVRSVCKSQQIHSQVRFLVLPTKKQKQKTRIRSGENPEFMESFLLHKVNPEEVNSMGLRFRLYSCERMRREHLIGEAVLSFATLDLQSENTLWLQLDSKLNNRVMESNDDVSLARSDSTGSTTSIQHSLGHPFTGTPEILLGLCYNSIVGRLSVEVSNFFGKYQLVSGIFSTPNTDLLIFIYFIGN